MLTVLGLQAILNVFSFPLVLVKRGVWRPIHSNSGTTWAYKNRYGFDMAGLGYTSPALDIRNTHAYEHIRL